MFNPICNPKYPPIKLIKNINSPPNIELKTNFKILFNGNKKILDIINITIIHAKKVIILFKLTSPALLINML